VERKVDLMRLVYGQQVSLQGSSLQNQDSDSEDEELFRLRKNDHKVCVNSCSLSPSLNADLVWVLTELRPN